MRRNKHTVTANEEVWRNYLQVHDKTAQFQKKGCDHYKLLEIIFNKNNASGGTTKVVQSIILFLSISNAPGYKIQITIQSKKSACTRIKDQNRTK
ncbi:L10-interacting MYB domain-containing protein [Trifolium repens]|nr:L10-interacting MYB domain-containing protein [Trifolium repens]